MGGSSSPPPPTTTSTFTPSPEQRELMGLTLTPARQFAATTPTRYPGATVPGFDPAQVAGQALALSAAPAQADIASAAGGATTGLLDFNPSAERESTINAVTRPIQRAFLEETLPALRGEAIQAGGLGGSRQGVAQGLAAGRTAQAIGDAASKVSTDLYATDMKARLQALGLAPQTSQLALGPAMTVSGVGDVRQRQTGQELADIIDAYNFGTNNLGALWQAQQLAGLIGAFPGGTQTTTGSVAPGPSNAQKALGGALAGAGAGATFGPIGAGVGAAGGALLPFLFA